MVIELAENGVIEGWIVLSQHDSDSCQLENIPIAQGVIAEGYNLPAFPSEEMKLVPTFLIPALHAKTALKRLGRWIRNFFVVERLSIVDIKDQIRSASSDKRIVNLIKVNQKVAKVKESILNGVSNSSGYVLTRIGSYSSENIMIAKVVRKHFIDVGFTSVEVTEAFSGIYVHVIIPYKELECAI